MWTDSDTSILPILLKSLECQALAGSFNPYFWVKNFGNAMIRGKDISLRALTVDDKDTFYHWATQSDGTEFWYGERTGEKIPSREAFFEDWKDYYFDGTRPLKGRSFAIVINDSGREIGQINYQQDEEDKAGLAYDLDIIIASKNDHKRGFGSQAIRLLSDYLASQHRISYFTMYTLPENQLAFRSFQKAGFRVLGEHKDENGIVWTKLVMEK